ncbi:MAG: FAD binding domain-containing protein [Anaerolineales bacterium]|nr:FAD binding domain-containing protein [Anaerolineales bacterium]
MITEYHRPHTLEEALKLLARPGVRPLGGGTWLTQQRQIDFEVVDLQRLGLNRLDKMGNKLEIGATVTLQSLLEFDALPKALQSAIKLEAPLNLRNAATVAGALIACDGRSSFATAMLALDARCSIAGGEPVLMHLGDLLPLREEQLRGKLITTIEIPLNLKLAFEYVARTPADRPILCAALAQWPSGRTRLVLGGWGNSPTVAMDGSDATGLEPAARNAAYNADDEWASSEYRRQVAVTLAKRCLKTIQES